jgi:Tol biopolymer transport system component
MVHDLETGQREILGHGELPFYSPSGHLLYQAGPRTYDLWALPFSLDTLRATGEAFPISADSRHPTVSADGTLTYIDVLGSGKEQLAWLDQSGHKTGDIGPPLRRLGAPALSPDGGLVAVEVWEGGSDWDVWVLNIARSVRTRLSTAPGYDGGPVWSPTGEEVVFTSSRAGNQDIVLRQADGSGETEVLASTPHDERTCDWSRDGKHLFYELHKPESGCDLWYLKRSEETGPWEPHPFLQTSFNEHGAKLSPDGRYVAYVSDESGQREVYVRAFPEGGRKWTVSRDGGERPRWSRDGQKLFYVEGRTLVAVSVSGDPPFSVGSATRLFEHSTLREGNRDPRYDVSADGQRFLLAEPVGGAAGPSIRVVLNWFAEFRDRR